MPITKKELQEREVALLECQRELAQNNATLAGYLVESRKLQLRNEELRILIRNKTFGLKNAALIYKPENPTSDDDW